MLRSFKRACALAIIVWPGLASAADADQVDGTWCSPGGETMTIEGTKVQTPTGKALKGRRNQHGFDYEIPTGEPHAGGRIFVEPMNDKNVRVTLIKPVQTEPGAHETWTRCDVVS